jgi:hypothetical protein
MGDNTDVGYVLKKRNELYESLYDIFENWNESYCYTGDDGGRVEQAIVTHARVLLAMPGASFDEIYQFLLNQ